MKTQRQKCIINKLGESIKMARIRAGLSQGQLAKRIGRSGALIAYWEQGKRNVSSNSLRAIAKATEQSLSFFFSDEDYHSKIEHQLSDLFKELKEIKEKLYQIEKKLSSSSIPKQENF